LAALTLTAVAAWHRVRTGAPDEARVSALLLGGLVLLPHGGPHTVADEWYFDPDAQFLANAFHFTSTFEVDGAVNFNSTLTVDDTITINGAGNYVRGGSLRQHKKLIPLTQFSSFAGSATVSFGGAFAYTGIDMYGGLASTACMLDLPVGCTVDEVRVGVKSTGNGSSVPIEMHIQRVTVDTVAPTSANSQVSGASDVATAGTYDILTTGSISSVIDTTSYLTVVVTGGTDAITGDRDTLLWCEVTYSGFFASEYE
jgi:hypothetical protein